MIGGYVSVTPLEDEEAALLADLVRQRRSARVFIAFAADAPALATAGQLEREALALLRIGPGTSPADATVALEQLYGALSTGGVVMVDAAADPDVRCVILTGNGPSFSAGGDVREMKRQASPDVSEMEIRQQYRRGIQRLVDAGGDPRKVVFSGVGKSEAEMAQALEAAALGDAQARHCGASFSTTSTAPPPKNARAAPTWPPKWRPAQKPSAQRATPSMSSPAAARMRWARLDTCRAHRRL